MKLSHCTWAGWDRRFSPTEQGSSLQSLICVVSFHAAHCGCREIHSSALRVSVWEFSTTDCRPCKLLRSICSLPPLTGGLKEQTVLSQRWGGWWQEQAVSPLRSVSWERADLRGLQNQQGCVTRAICLSGCPLGLQEASSSHPSPWQPFPRSSTSEAERSLISWLPPVIGITAILEKRTFLHLSGEIKTLRPNRIKLNKIFAIWYKGWEPWALNSVPTSIWALKGSFFFFFYWYSLFSFWWPLQTK